jgi:PAS domain S-box-containing protein
MDKRDVSEVTQCFEGIFALGNSGIVIVNHDGTVLRVNPAFSKILGYAENEIVGKPFYILAYKTQRLQTITSHNWLHRFYCSEKTSMETIFFNRWGHDVPVRLRSVIIRNVQGEITQAIGMIEPLWVGTGTDQGERSLAQKMWEAQQNFENILNNSADAIVICDISGTIMMANRSFLETLDYCQEEVIGKHIVEFTAFEEGTYLTSTGENVTIDSAFVSETAAKSAELFEMGHVSNWESFLVKKNNVHVPSEITMSVLKDMDGERRGTLVILRDITERKKTEAETRKARDFLENIFKTSVDGILVTNKGLITMVNEAVEKITGYARDEIIGKHTFEFSAPGKLYEEQGKEFVEKLYEDNTVTGREMTWQKKDGSLLEVEVSAALVKDDTGNVTSVSSIRDITERKRMEKQFFQSAKLKSLGELAGGVAHDFNNVLAAILGRVQLLRMHLAPVPGRQEKRKAVIELQKGLEIIEKAAFDGAETVRRIQEFSRKRPDDKHFTNVDINQLIKHALEFARPRWKDQSESKGIKITVKKELSRIPTTSGREAELREVFTNLVNNALDAMPRGGCLTIKTLRAHDTIGVTIKDTGNGIPQELQERIFDPFFTTKGPQSSGLGLSVSYGIITRHRGTITVESAEGEGTAFTITLPITEAGIIEEKPAIIPAMRKRARILVVEDEEGVRNVLHDILAEADHQVETATDGTTGIELFEQKTFDLVFTDLGMPGMSGWQVAEKIKSINGKVPVALITGWNVELKESNMKDCGVDLIIKKPFAVNQVLQLVQEGMELRERFNAA